MFHNKEDGDANGKARRIHYGLISKLSKRDKVELFVYGPKTAGLKENVPVIYNKKITMRDLRDKIKPDVVLTYGLHNVNGDKTNRWFPNDFKIVQLPKVMIECDWWAIKPKQRRWYKENGISFLIQRGAVRDTNTGLRSTWLPFSAAEEDFVEGQKIPLKKRPKKIGFIGRGAGRKYNYVGVYQNRHIIINALKRNGLLNIRGEVGHAMYPFELRKFQCCLSDSGRLSSPPGKVFEIMASGTLLLTDPFRGFTNLFRSREVCKFYKTDRSNVVRVAKEVYNADVDSLQSIVDEAVKEVNEKHLDRHRVAELEYILRNYLETGSVEQIWTH